MPRKTQIGAILDHMKDHGSITSREARDNNERPVSLTLSFD